MASGVTEERAARLAERWAASGSVHLAFGAGCACGGGFGAIGPAELDDLTVRYLRAKYGDAGRDALVDLVTDDSGTLLTIETILHRLAAAPPTEEDATLLLDDLERTIGSFEEMHRGR